MVRGEDEFYLTRHAAERLRLRGISPEMVREVIADPQITIHRDDGCEERLRNVGARRIKVIVNPKTHPVTIISAFDQREGDPA